MPDTDLAIIEQHERVVLLFSGGKDSLACLHLCRPWWDRIFVVWINGQDNFPETNAQMAQVRAEVPTFVEIQSDVRSQIEENGWPVDALPSGNTEFGRLVAKKPGPRMQIWMNCCGENKWLPALNAIRGLEATLVIRGDRAEESRRAPMTNGAQIPGVQALFPIWNWSTAQVMDYLRETIPGRIPAHYLSGAKASLDCQSCTAFAGENGPAWGAYVRKHHPETANEIGRRFEAIRDALAAHVETTNATAQALKEQSHG